MTSTILATLPYALSSRSISHQWRIRRHSNKFILNTPTDKRQLDGRSPPGSLIVRNNSRLENKWPRHLVSAKSSRTWHDRPRPRDSLHSLTLAHGRPINFQFIIIWGAVEEALSRPFANNTGPLSRLAANLQRARVSSWLGLYLLPRLPRLYLNIEARPVERAGRINVYGFLRGILKRWPPRGWIYRFAGTHNVVSLAEPYIQIAPLAMAAA